MAARAVPRRVRLQVVAPVTRKPPARSAGHLRMKILRSLADFPPPMGGTGSAPNPLAYCFWGGMACYAMTYAQEAAKQGIQLRALRARAEAEVDMTRALGVSDNPPVERIDWHLEVEADSPREKLDELKRLADEQCPGVYCVRQPFELATHLEA